MNKFEQLLSGDDLRSIGKANPIALRIKDQGDFDELFGCLSVVDRVIAMRAADAIEKCSGVHPVFLQPHKREILQFLQTSGNIEFKWHLAQMCTRLFLTEEEVKLVAGVLEKWLLDKSESRIVRVNALQGLYDIFQERRTGRKDLLSKVKLVYAENVPSLNSRIRKLFGNNF